ncbi:hypothetical protein M2271_007188 [Streptomyces sp. LBL]|uniref:hypothetical protein n=1 Tax=Streptomyces sp. LBL TaxID=2940562 RepID=UPI0024766C37|nr:hypothetical protein [Streptomyces sp. LBL]MDH6629352.1 hypothetical protein [Streptomyces sp. LBL]
MANTAIAPYAQAAAVVNSDGTVMRSHGVINVERYALGSYSIEVDASIDMANAVPIAVMRAETPLPPAIFYVHSDNSNTFAVMCQHPTKGAQDTAFHVIVP